VNPAIVTLTTDFGLRDSFVGTMKGVLLSRCPGVQIVDICHDVPPQDVRRGAMRLAAAARYFPTGTVHLAVVDPGVGSLRRAIALHVGGHYFVGPDNGLLSLAAPMTAADWSGIALTRPEYWLPIVSNTFHGRDVFAPVAAFLAGGGALGELGEPLTKIRSLALEDPVRLGDSLHGKVIDVDRFGNLITNVKASDLLGFGVDRIRIGEHVISGLSVSYDASRALVALLDSDGHLEIAVPGGSAARDLQLAIDTPVEVFSRADPSRGG
jgi:S-adenosylmethionine hydrolase